MEKKSYLNKIIEQLFSYRVKKQQKNMMINQGEKPDGLDE
jgi:hypothetical protein